MSANPIRRIGLSISVSDIFCCGYAVYFWQSIKLRYPEYCQKQKSTTEILAEKEGKRVERQPQVAVTEFSELYRNKGTNRYYRAYVEVHKANVKEKSN